MYAENLNFQLKSRFFSVLTAVRDMFVYLYCA